MSKEAIKKSAKDCTASIWDLAQDLKKCLKQYQDIYAEIESFEKDMREHFEDIMRDDRYGGEYGTFVIDTQKHIGDAQTELSRIPTSFNELLCELAWAHSILEQIIDEENESSDFIDESCTGNQIFPNSLKYEM